MRYNFRTGCNLLIVVLFAGLAACDDNDQWVPGDIPGKGQTAIYSNKLSASVEGNALELTYGGQELIGKEVVFSRDGDGHAGLTLSGIVPGEPETQLTGVVLTADGGAWTFGGAATVQNGTAFRYDGKIEKGKLTLALTDVKIPGNLLTNHSTWYTIPQATVDYDADTAICRYGCYLSSDHAAFDDFGMVVGMVGGNLLTSVVRDITFGADGNITAHYAPLPEGVAVTDLIFSPLVRPEGDWLSSPVNLASYYVEGNSLYVLPQIDQIIQQVKADITTRAGEMDAVMNLLALYKQLNEWSTKGIRFTIREEVGRVESLYGGAVFVKYDGDVLLHLDVEELQHLVALLPLLKDQLPAEVLDIFGPLFDAISDGLPGMTRLDLGIILTRE